MQAGLFQGTAEDLAAQNWEIRLPMKRIGHVGRADQWTNSCHFTELPLRLFRFGHASFVALDASLVFLSEEPFGAPFVAAPGEANV